jgi:hypothetical protein
MTSAIFELSRSRSMVGYHDLLHRGSPTFSLGIGGRRERYQTTFLFGMHTPVEWFLRRIGLVRTMTIVTLEWM